MLCRFFIRRTYRLVIWFNMFIGVNMIKEYSLETLLSGSNILSKKYMKVSNLSRELFKKSVNFALENNIAVNNL